MSDQSGDPIYGFGQHFDYKRCDEACAKRKDKTDETNLPPGCGCRNSGMRVRRRGYSSNSNIGYTSNTRLISDGIWHR